MSDISAFEKPYIEYWAALGRFIHEFSRVERIMQALLHHFSGVPGPVGRAAFSGMKTDAAMSIINRILDATGREAPKRRLSRVFPQLGEINSARNRIVHWGAQHDGGDDLLVTNDFLAHTPDRLQQMRVSHLTLTEMHLDLYKISVHLQLEIYARQLDRELYWLMLRDVVHAPWQYKPPRQLARPKAPREHPPRRKRQRDTSPA